MEYTRDKIPMPEYTHTLITDRVDFVPNPKQVGVFLASLVALGAAPLNLAITVSKLSGNVRTGVNPFTGKTETYAKRDTTKVEDIAEVPDALQGLDDYNLTVMGKGPPKMPAFEFDFNGAYDFLVRCSLRSTVVSTSDPHDGVPPIHTVESFGRPCSPDDRLGIFHNPNTLEVIEVPNAGARGFASSSRFGKTLFPHIEDSLDLIEPAIIQAAETDFRIEFVQGCHWCA